jgi:F1F0 ATPase subunit 2
MNEALTLSGAGLAGAALGAMFFGGLWWTVRRGVSSAHPALWFLGSGMLRLGFALTGFYFVGGGSWRRWVGALVGFIAARFVTGWLTRPARDGRRRSVSEARHAP